MSPMKLVARREMIHGAATTYSFDSGFTSQCGLGRKRIGTVEVPGVFCQGGTAVPEFDGSAAVAVVSLLAGVCGLIYSRDRS